MDDFIRREDVRTIIRSKNPYSGDWFSEEDLDAIPSANVREQKARRWIKDENGAIVCPECGEKYDWVPFRDPFCDCCGAELEPEEGYNNE